MSRDQKKPRAPDQAPHMALDDRELRDRYYEQSGKATVDRNWWRMFALLLLVILSVSVVTNWQLFPLKTIKPWVIEVDKAGKAVASDIQAVEYKPTDPVKRYFLERFVNNLLEIDQYKTDKQMEEVFFLLVGKADTEIRDFLAKDLPFKRLAADPNLTRKVTVSALNMIGDGAAVARVQLDETDGGGIRKTTFHLVTLHYVVNSDQNEASLKKNPSGIYIQHFDIATEAGNVAPQ